MAGPLDLAAVGPAIQGVVEQALDRVVTKAVAEPLEVQSPDEVRAAVEGPSSLSDPDVRGPGARRRRQAALQPGRGPRLQGVVLGEGGSSPRCRR